MSKALLANHGAVPPRDSRFIALRDDVLSDFAELH